MTKTFFQAKGDVMKGTNSREWGMQPFDLYCPLQYFTSTNVKLKCSEYALSQIKK